MDDMSPGGGGQLPADLASVLDEMPCAVVVKDRDGVVRYANAQFAAILNMSIHEIVGRSERDRLPETSADEFRTHDLDVIRSGHGLVFADTLTTDAGDRYFRTLKVPLRAPDGSIWGVCSLATEVTPEQQLEDALRASRDQLLQLAQWSPGMVYQFRRRPDGGYDLPFSSRGIREIFEVEPEDVLHDADPLFARVHADDTADFISSIERSDLEGTPWQAEFRVVLPVAGERWIRASSVPERVDGGVVWHGYAEDVTNRKLSEADMWHRANYDSLTTLPNRDLALDRLDQAIRICRRNGTGLALLFSDLDGFKDVNDRHGHLVGDRVLAEVGHRLRECVRESDTVARYGGDEFLILLPDAATPAHVQRVCEEVMRKLAQPVDVDGTRIELRGLSMGCAFYPRDGEEATTLVAVADARMYEAKSTLEGAVPAATDVPADEAAGGARGPSRRHASP